MKTTTAYFRRIRLRALAVLLGIALASFATVALAGAPLIPVISVAVAAAAMSLSKAAQRLIKPTCLECGSDLTGEPVGTYGIICKDCGAVHQPKPQNDHA